MIIAAVDRLIRRGVLPRAHVATAHAPEQVEQL